MVLLPIVDYFVKVNKAMQHGFKKLLSEAPQDVRSMFPHTYDSNGLKYNLQYLKEIFNSVAKMTAEEQAKFADYETVEWVKFCNDNVQGGEADREYFQEHRVEMLKEAYGDLNTTAIGNLAYIAEHLISNENTFWFPNDCYNYLSKLRFYANQYFVD